MHINKQLEIIPVAPYTQPTIITIIDREEIEVEVEREGPDGTTYTEIVIEIVETEREEESYTVHPISIFTRWSREEKAAVGIYEVEQEPVPEGFYATGWEYEIVGDYAIGTPTLEPIPEPEPYVPQVISFAQGKRAMIRRGYWQVANAYVDAIEDETERLLAQSALHDPQEFHRTSPFLNYLAGVLGIPDSEIDEMFIEGAADII